MKRWVLSLVKKDEKVGELRIWLGKQFQTVGAEIEKELLVKHRLVQGTLQSLHDAERRRVSEQG